MPSSYQMLLVTYTWFARCHREMIAASNLSKKKKHPLICQLRLFSANLTCVNICMNITRFNNWDKLNRFHSHVCPAGNHTQNKQYGWWHCHAGGSCQDEPAGRVPHEGGGCLPCNAELRLPAMTSSVRWYCDRPPQTMTDHPPPSHSRVQASV